MYRAWIGRERTGEFWKVEAIGDVTVTQTKNEPASLKATFLRDGYLTVENGDNVAIQNAEDGDNNLFYGKVETTTKKDNRVEVTAFDQLNLLKKKTLIKVFGDMKASDLFIKLNDLANLYMLNPPEVRDTEYPIPGVVADNTTALDLMNEVLNITYKATGRRYVIWDAFRNLRLELMENQRIDPKEFVINYDNVISMTYEEDISDLINEVIIMSDEQNAYRGLAVRRNEGAIDLYSERTYMDKVKDGENADVIAETLLEEKMVKAESMNVSVVGDNVQVYPGRIVTVDFYHTSTNLVRERIMGDFVIESVTHTLSDGTGKMDLSLKLFDKMGEFNE